MMASDITVRRIPWVALTLSFLSAGVGHFYCGRIAKGLPLYFAWLLVPICVTIAALLPPSATSLLLLVLLPIFTAVVLYLYAAIDAWRLADRIGSDYSLRDCNRAAIYALLIVVQLFFSIGLFLGVRTFVYEPYFIPTNSMSPTILCGDRILARKLLSLHHFPARGNLILYRNPSPQGGPIFHGRVIAVAGDHLEIIGNRVLIDGKELKRDRVPQESLPGLGEQVSGQVAYEVNSGHRYLVTYEDSAKEKITQGDFEATVPARHVFVMGDNRNYSRDSREFGAIHAGDIVGYVDYIHWPAESWSRFGVANGRLP